VAGQLVPLLERLLAELAGERLVVVVHPHHVHAQLVGPVARIRAEGTADGLKQTFLTQSDILNFIPGPQG
jgi:hypothetical protein